MYYFFTPYYIKGPREHIFEVLLALGLLFYRASSVSTMMEGRARDSAMICKGTV